MTNACIEDFMIKIRNLRKNVKQNVIYSNSKLKALNALSVAEYELSNCETLRDRQERYEP